MQELLVNGAPFCYENAPKSGIEADLANFLADWFSPADTIELQTSGSTGTPKTIRVRKEYMRNSAEATCRFFGLHDGAKALLCLPLRYIAGKMMVVRALVGKLNLITTEPTSTPFTHTHGPIDFAALVPMQAKTTLRQQNGRSQLAQARTILLGGGFIEPLLEDELQTCQTDVYASYGMTETLSHIALRKVNGTGCSPYYSPLAGVKIGISAFGTLTISAPHIGVDYLETNDLAEILPNDQFRILGRIDSVINSGGIKIQAESVEQALASVAGVQVLVVPIPHPILGQAVGLLWEGSPHKEKELQQAIDGLPKYHRPHLTRNVMLPRTATGKINRAEAAKLLK